jgi:hypothetical protein
LSLILAASSTQAAAYNPFTHYWLSDAAVNQSVLGGAEGRVLENLGVQHPLPSSDGSKAPPKRLIQNGAYDEDDGLRAINHFFDPQNGGRALTTLLPNLPSPTWAIEDLFEDEDQVFSLRDARDYLYKSLTGTAKNERDKNLGLTFEALGHAIHHLQDMSQPQHVRNDEHCDNFLVCKPLGRYRPSAYEEYTRRQLVDIPTHGYPVVDYGTFGLPRSFWQNSGKGIAEFTSRNFVSYETNFHTRISGSDRVFHHHHEYPMPNTDNLTLDKRQVTDPDLLGPQGPGQPLSGEMWFIATPVYDQYTEAMGRNPRTSTYSIFDFDLNEEGKEQVFTLNRFNYQLANAFLLPRAVGYSAGLINHFFRGNIEISKPARGVYGVVDHAQTTAGEGFTKIRMALRNATPDGGGVPQEMPGGTLLAVAKYVRNACYQDDLSGEFAGVIDYFGGTITPSGCPIAAYLSGEEEISVSAPIVAAGLERDASTELEFDFSHAPIPIDSRDVVLQVVYTGRLGEESDAVVVGAKNISEPTYLAVFNNSDYFQLDGRLYTPEEIRSDPALTSRVDFDHDGDVDDKDINIDPEPMLNVRFAIGDHYLTEPATLDPKNYLRIAVLSDTEELIPVRIPNRFASTFGSNNTYNVVPLQTQLSRQPYVLSALDKTRGVHFWFMLFVVKYFGPGTPPIGTLKTLEPVSPDPGPTPVTLVSP